MQNIAFRFGIIFLAVGFLSACETISEEQCKSGSWESIGHADGSRGIAMARFQSYVKKCSKSNVKPDFQAYKRGRHDGLKIYCNRQGNSNGASGGELGSSSSCSGALSAHYQAGYTTGLRSFCSYNQGRSMGANGEPSKAYICPAGSLRTEFSSGYATGMKDFCEPGKAFAAGKGGKNFSIGFCPSAERSRVRRAYETGKEVAVIESEIAEAEAQISSLEEKILDPAIPSYERRKMQLTVQELNRKIRRAERERYDLKREF